MQVYVHVTIFREEKMKSKISANPKIFLVAPVAPNSINSFADKRINKKSEKKEFIEYTNFSPQ